MKDEQTNEPENCNFWHQNITFGGNLGKKNNIANKNVRNISVSFILVTKSNNKNVSNLLSVNNRFVISRSLRTVAK